MQTLELTEETDRFFPRNSLDEQLAEALYGDKRFEVEWPNPGNQFQYRIRSKGYVGHIPVYDSIVVVEPKVSVANIFAMLEVAYDLQSFKVFDGETDIQNLDDLVETVVSILSDQVLNRIRRGLYRHYVEETEDLSFVRGRIDIRGNLTNVIRQNPKLRCRYEEMTADLEEDQILLWTLFLASRMGLQRPDVIAKVQRAYRALSGVIKLTEFEPRDCVGRFYHRLNDDYRPMHGLCRLILENTSPEILIGDRRFIPFVVDMPLLFEAFVAKWLKANVADEFSVDEQYTAHLDANAVLNFRIDIVLRERASGRPLMVLDTKYKSSATPDEFDVQQVIAYANELGTDNAVLVYPQPLAQPVEITSGSISIKSLGFDIGSNLPNTGSQFLSELGFSATHQQKSN